MLIVIWDPGKGAWATTPPPHAGAPPLDGTLRRKVSRFVTSHRAAGRARARRVLNVGVAALLLAAAIPVMLLIALAVRLSSRGPVLFTQLRVGVDRRGRSVPEAYANQRRRDYGGRVFRMYKFRTMTVDGGGGQRWAGADTHRITGVGRILRKTRLDELPQLFNVLRGDMNIVGPRPEQPQIFQKLRERIPDYPVRQRVLPGITGWAQVNQHYDRCLADVRRKVALDLEYIHRQSALEDFRIMLRTVPVMLLRKGAQ